VVVIMLPNCRISMRRAASPWMLALPIMAISCGGKDDVRPVGDSTKITKSAAPTNCKAEDALALKEYLPRAEFEQSATGWQTSTDKSPSPATAPRPIKSCPQDSSYDCCLSGELTEAEQALQDTYECAPAGAATCPGFAGSVGIQAIPAGEGIACKGDVAPGSALHVRAARFTDWGAQIYYSFSPARDASEFDGVSFWVRRGQGGSGVQPVGQSLFIVFDDKFTKENQTKYEIEVDPETGDYVMIEDPITKLLVPKPVLDANGDPVPVYPAYSTEVQASNCYDVNVDAMKCDRFGAGVGLEPEWRFVKIPFDSMRQRGYGVKSPAGRLLKEELLAFGIYMDIGNWDFWIDQIAFYKDHPPVE
jgi:hypothetical protein